LALYLWLLVGGVLMLERVRRGDQALGLALAATFLALFVHALFYSGFLEDPITWVVLAVGAGYLSWREIHEPPLSAAERARQRASHQADNTAPVRAEPGPSRKA
jgi:peptidoglycan/LPS O-acetylase OafA/YrhL